MSVSLYTIGVTILVSFFRRDTHMGVRKVGQALYSGACASVDVAIPSAIAGIIVGILVYTGLALRLQELIISTTHGLLLPCLVGAMLFTILLGMGMPTVATYLLSSILVAPTIRALGVSALASHMFIFHFGCLSMVTPPVALASFAASGISGGSLTRTGIKAFMLSLPGFLIPYAFILNSSLLLDGTWSEIAWCTGTAVIGIFTLATAVIGWMYRPVGLVERCLWFVVSILFIIPERFTDVLGFSIGIVLLLLHWRFTRQEKVISVSNKDLADPIENEVGIK